MALQIASDFLTPPQNAAWILAELDKRDQALRKHATAEIQAMERRILALLPQCDVGSIVESEPKKKRACEVCGDITIVHKHRSLGLLLDDKCRKQVDTFKQGGTITERRDAWRSTLQQTVGSNPNSLANQLLVHLGAGELNVKKRKAENAQIQPPCKSACSQCSICHDVMKPRSKEDVTGPDKDHNAPYDMPCGHTFHQNCIVQWLQEKPSCPVCRTEVKLEYVLNTEAACAPQECKQSLSKPPECALNACSPTAALEWGEWLASAQADTLPPEIPGTQMNFSKDISNTSLGLKRDPSFGDNWLEFLEA